MKTEIILIVTVMLAVVCRAGAAECSDSIDRKQLHEVVVTGRSALTRMNDTRLGAETLELAKLASAPALFGENDIIKSITLMPGVHSEGEGAGGFEVRGGTASQNLVTLDGITMYNPAHVMGIFSTFNDNALGRATLYKGPIPAAYGGATASVLEASLAPGDMDSWHASATVGVLAAKLKAEGPVVGDRLSLAVTGRRSYVDMFLKIVPRYRHIVMNFYDVTAKLRYRAGRGDYVDLSVTASRDNMCIGDMMRMHWGNAGASVNWTAARGDSWRFVTTAAISGYTSDMGMAVMRSDQELKEYIKNVSVNHRSIYAIGDDHRVEVGVRSELQRVKSGEFQVNSTTLKEVRSGWNNALWLNYDGGIGGNFAVSAGVRLGLFTSLSGRAFHEFDGAGDPEPDFSSRTYCTPEPRISLKYEISRCHNLKAGVAVASQNIHAIRSSATSFPFDRYALTSATVRPERAVQYGVGYSGMSAGGDYDWSAECYFKSVDNVYDYQDGRTMLSRIDLESIILGGRGRSAGLELMLRKNTGRLTGWVSYTLSKTQTRISGVNGGRWYDAANDRRHHFSVVGIYRLDERWEFSGSWTFSSGQPITAPDVKYELDGVTCYYYSQRNGYRVPSSHRLGLSAAYTIRGRRFTRRWAFGLYNAYCRYNPFIVYFEDDPSKPSGTRAVQQSLYGLVPSVSYTLKF
ncbi:MAG: TonB-dependent receptor plug domain-containing protein [Muribaculaceae bacterium]|nr:TonB-dependent receptor plug domain-containing protein [Muribaculaceae bacterium]